MASRVEASLRVEGAAELRRTLKAAGDDLNDLKDAHATAARLVAADAAQRAPRRTGRLASNVRGSGAKTSATIRAGGAKVPYAGPIHWGWPAHNIKPNPFIAEAAQTTEGAWTAIYHNSVQRILDRVKGT